MSPPRYNALRWALLAVVPVLVVFLAGLADDRWFRFLGVEPMKPVFSDTIAILAAGEAHAAGIPVDVPNPLDPFRRPHVYGALWLVSGTVGLDRTDAWWLGTILAASFLLVAAAVLSPRSLPAAATAALLLAAPATLLALQRGNNDLVIFVLLALAGALVVRKRPVAGAVAAGIVSLALALKVYPAAALPMLLARPGRRGALILAGAASFVAAAVIAAGWEDFQKVSRLAPELLSIYCHGLKLSYYTLTTMPGPRLWILAGFIPILSGAALLIWQKRGAMLSSIPVSGFTAACFVAGAGSWVFCYVVTTNFPYRLVLFLLPARLWLEQTGDSRQRATALAQLSGLVLLNWLAPLKDHLLVTQGDAIVGGPPLVWIAVGAEQALALTLSAGMLTALLGWFVRRLRSPD